MKTLTILMTLMMVLAAFGVAAAQEDTLGEDIKGKKLIHRYNVVHIQMERHRIGMQAIIDYIDSNGTDTTGLVAIKDDFVAMDGELKTLAEADDREGFQAKFGQTKDTVKAFRDGARGILGADIGGAKEAVEAALAENKDYLDSLVAELNKARGEAELEVEEEAAEDAEEKIRDYKAKGTDVAAIQAKLDEIREKRDDLKTKMEAAVASCSDTGLGICETPEAQEYQALKEEIKQDYKDLRDIARSNGRAHKVANAIDAAKKVLGGQNERLDKAEAGGRDVTVERAMLDEVDFYIQEAQARYDAGDYEGAMDDLDAANDAFRTTQKDARDRGKEAREDRRPEKPDPRGARGANGDDGDSDDDDGEEDDGEDDSEDDGSDTNETESDS